MTDDLGPDDDGWDMAAARAKLAPRLDGRKAARKTRQKKLADSVDGRSLRATGRTEQLNFKARPEIKQLLDRHVPHGSKSIWLEEAIVAKLRAGGSTSPMRKLLIALLVIGSLGGVAMCAVYGWDQATDLKGQMTQSFIYGFMAIATLVLHALALRLCVVGWRWCGVFVWVAAALAFLMTAFTSLGGLASRSDSIVSERKSAINAADDAEARINELVKQRTDLGTFKRTTKAAVDAAKTAAETATVTKERECAAGKKSERGNFCRQREDAEEKALKAHSDAVVAKASTDRFDEIEAELKALRAKREAGTGVGSADPLRALLSTIVGAWADLLTSGQKVGFAIVYDMALIALALGVEVLGHAQAPLPKREPMKDRIGGFFTRLRKSTPTPPSAPVVIPPAPKPKLAASNPGTPVGSVKRILTDNLKAAPGERVEFAELASRYKHVCRIAGKVIATQDVFVREVDAFCKEIGIKRRAVGDNLYLLDVQLVPTSNTTSADQSMNS
jgi:hypothetical protein